MFIESPRFPDRIAYGSSGGPRYSTTVAVTYGGFEKRNIGWEKPRQEYNAAFGIRDLVDLEELLDFFHVARGRAYAFRFKDFADYQSCSVEQDPTPQDQEQDTGGSVTFRLRKVYSVGATTQTRPIYKPVEGTVRIAVDGTETQDFSVDYTTGVVTLGSKSVGIFAVDDGSDVIVIDDDITADVEAGDNVEIVNDPDNEGVYTVQSVTLDGSQTRIGVEGSLSATSTPGDLLYDYPDSNNTVTAGYEFDVPVRFATDTLELQHESYLAGTAEVPLIEVRNEN